MRKIISTIILLVAVAGVAPVTQAAFTNIYVEDWGTGNPNVVFNNDVTSVGWTSVALSRTAGPYVGIYNASPQPSDAATGDPLLANTVYFTVLLPTQTTPGMIYTTDSSGAGAGGNSSFTTINNPNLKTNLTLSVEERNGGGAPGTNYFAVQVGGSWYVATSYIMPDSGALGFPLMTNATLVYTNSANVWNSLTINANDVTIGGAASPNLSSPITGVGIVITPTTGQPNFNRFAVQIFAPNPPPPNPPTNSFASAVQNVYEGGGVSLVTRFTGTAPLSYKWKTNDIPLAEGGKYIGTTNNTLIITNVTQDDATANGVTYSVTATNIAGVTNSPAGSLFVNVLPRPIDMLYSETLPYAGPSGNLPLTGVGWANAFATGASGGIFSLGTGTGLGAYFDYSGFTTVATNLAYTTSTNDTGLSGLPFAAINIATHPVITFQAQFQPGNAQGRATGAVITYWAVRVNGAWYYSAQPIPIDLTATQYFTNQYAFKTGATNWNNLTVAGNVVTPGGPASSDLSGTIDGAGLLFVHNAVNTSMNFENFLLSTNPVSILPPAIGVNGAPWSQTVATGGGVSFGVAATGTQPFSYGWTLNGVLLQNGGRISGAHSNILTIANLTPADNGQIIAWVTNSAGVDDSLNSPNGGGGVDTELTVVDPPVGTIYTETFPFIGPLPGNNFSIGTAGWSEAVPGSPFVLFQRVGSDAAAFAFFGSPSTNVFFTSTASDTNQAGLPFPNINLASYSDLTFSVDIAPTFNSANVTAYVAVQINGNKWYVSANPLPVPVGDTTAYSTYSTAFSANAANWKNLTINATTGTIGAPASSDLQGTMTGFGLVFVTTGAGGNFNFDNISITATGVGGITIGSAANGTLNLSWVGNPAVHLQSTTNLASSTSWQDVPNSAGLYSLPVSTTGPQKFFRLVTP
jgi:hypothetical protein